MIFVPWWRGATDRWSHPIRAPAKECEGGWTEASDADGTEVDVPAAGSDIVDHRCALLRTIVV